MKQGIIFTLGLLAGALLAPVLGMALEPTRDIILGMAPEEAVLVLAEKIDRESQRIDNQESEIEQLKKENDEKNERLEALNSKMALDDCKKWQVDCAEKIYQLENGEIDIYWQGNLWKGNRSELEDKLNSSIAGWEKAMKETDQSSRKDDLQWNIDQAEDKLERLDKIIIEKQSQKEELLLEECNNYKEPCE